MTYQFVSLVSTWLYQKVRLSWY